MPQAKAEGDINRKVIGTVRVPARRSEKRIPRAERGDSPHRRKRAAIVITDHASTHRDGVGRHHQETAIAIRMCHLHMLRIQHPIHSNQLQMKSCLTGSRDSTAIENDLTARSARVRRGRREEWKFDDNAILISAFSAISAVKTPNLITNPASPFRSRAEYPPLLLPSGAWRSPGKSCFADIDSAAGGFAHRTHRCGGG